MTPTISAIIPLYNRLDLLEGVVDSILAQTLPVMEVILVDDGSTQHRPEDVEKLIAARPGWKDRILYRYQENQGQSIANNAGIAMARGEWLAFDGNDDLWLPQKLEWQFKALEAFKSESEACFTDALFVNNTERQGTIFGNLGLHYEESIGLAKDSIALALTGKAVQVQTLVARAELVRKLGGLDPQLRWGEDMDFVFRLALHTKFCFVNMPLTAINRAKGRHGGQSELWHDLEYCLVQERYLYEKLLTLSAGLPNSSRRIIMDKLASVHSVLATLLLRKGEQANARRALTAAAKYKLTVPRAAKWLLTWAAPWLAGKLLAEPNWTWGQ